MRMYALFVLLMYATALNFEASLMSHTLAEVDALDTSQLNCQTPRSHFEDLEQTLTQWQQVLENKERIPSHIETLTQMKHLIKHKKYEQLVEKIKDLDLISPPVLSELQNKLQGLQSHDRHEREECTETLTKLCAYLIKQMNNVHQQCQQSPVTVIKVKGKIEDLKIIQSGCQQACQPTCPDEPAPEAPSEAPSEEFTEEPVEEGVPPTTPDDQPTPDNEPTPDDKPTPDEPTPDDKPTPDEPIVPQDEEGPTDEPPVNPSTEESPDEPTVAEEGTEEWTIPGEEPEQPIPTPSTPDQPEEDQEESSNPPVSPDPLVFPEEYEEQFGFEETTLPPVSPDPLVFPEEHEEQFIFEETPLPPVTPDAVLFPEEEEYFNYEESPLPPVSPNVVLPEEEEEQFNFEETPIPRISPLRSPFSEEHEEFVFEEQPEEEEGPRVCHSSESTDMLELAATQLDPEFTSTLTIIGHYGFGLYFQRLQKYPALAEGTEFHLASLQDNGNTVLGVFVTNTGVKCVTADGTTYQSTSVPNNDIEGDWSFVFISHGQGVTGCGVKFFEEQTALRQTPASHPTYTSLDFKIGGPQDSHPSFQGKVYGHYAVSASNLRFTSQIKYNLLVYPCNSPPEEEVCEQETDELGDYEFYGFEDTSDETFEFSTWDAGYSVSGWIKWEPIEDQDVWHTVFRLSENPDANLEEIKLGDRDLAVYIGNYMVGNVFQFTTYTYSGSGNPNLWDSLSYGVTLGQWQHVYFGYNRKLRFASYSINIVTIEQPLVGANQIHDARHYLVPWRRLYIGNDGLYPAFSGQFYNWRVNRCIGYPARDVVYSPDDIPFGYNPLPEVPESRQIPQIETFASPEEEQPYWGEEEQERVPVEPDAVPNVFPEEESIWPEEEEEFVPPQTFASPEEEQPYWGEEEQEFVPVPPAEQPPVIPDEIKPEPLPEPEAQPEPQPEPAPAPKPAPGPAPTSEPQVPAVKECEATIDVTKENAADILCAISEYLAQLASGHVPELGINPSRVCFCLQYDDSESNESFMQVEAILKENDAFTINKLVAQRRI
ncbi:unnamed protein product [Paramecium octaurelia]|uniref:Uncharacterized protein n=1 Tax=Paramecium octaurelia TaxID=43137 RepID=A0A8S1T181_PAROT|nr:unnamed protein product [Paramecium octaurelia]